MRSCSTNRQVKGSKYCWLIIDLSLGFKILSFENTRSHLTCVHGSMRTYLNAIYSVLNKPDLVVSSKIILNTLSKQLLQFCCCE